VLGLEDELYYPIVEMFDVREETLPRFSYEVIGAATARELARYQVKVLVLAFCESATSANVSFLITRFARFVSFRAKPVGLVLLTQPAALKVAGLHRRVK